MQANMWHRELAVDNGRYHATRRDHELHALCDLV